MKTMTYTAVALFVSSLLFVGSSFSGEMQMSEEMTGSNPMEVRWDAFEGSSFIGMSLETPEHDYIGHVDDLAINPSTGQIDSVLVSDITGLGDRKIFIPFSSISKWGEYTFFYHPREGLNRFTSEYPYWAYELEQLPPMHEGDYRFTTILGASVESNEGNNVARIDDFIINADGHVVYAVLRDVSGRGTELVAAPFGALSKKDGDMFVFDTTQEKLSTAPVFSWSDVTNPKFASDTYRYYGLQPYWEAK